MQIINKFENRGLKMTSLDFFQLTSYIALSVFKIIVDCIYLSKILQFWTRFFAFKFVSL